MNNWAMVSGLDPIGPGGVRIPSYLVHLPDWKETVDKVFKLYDWRNSEIEKAELIMSGEDFERVRQGIIRDWKERIEAMGMTVMKDFI